MSERSISILRDSFMAGETMVALALKYNMPLELVEDALRGEWVRDRLDYLQFLERILGLLREEVPTINAAIGRIQ